ncbi:MAG: tRNA (adenosine(37)-N6)-dimethylallyltransferase MiaA [Chloroflexi bacterium HGW-Chloroflexi-4]|jgi:tRNA dimethylallyltransferase|nr:MAG: tRNA (adenosine(37)-N6)-dimethylallyltransferase MiaA [Chloroflexi bacterium HGW-Chloroflexi-4]
MPSEHTQRQLSTNKRVLVLVGPTAVGKTELAIRLAEKLEGEIVSADSRLLYRGMDIGTAKPSRSEMARFPHHMIDRAEPNEIWSLATFQQKILSTIDEIQRRGKLPIVAGGTGQYIRSLMEGWIIPTVQPDPRLREVLEQIGLEIGAAELHRRLSLIDPIATAKMDANNLRRSIRALEVIFTTGDLFSTQKDKQPPDLDFKLIGLTRPREEIYARVDARIEMMFEMGFVEEVKALLEKGYNQDLPTLSAIGYCEVIQYLHGEIKLEETKVQMRKKTREFIRRQANWFKPDDTTIEWHDMTPDPLNEILDSIKSWLKGVK